MPRFARITEGSSPVITPIDRPFSNFAFIDQMFAGQKSLRRIFSQIRQHGARTMILQKLDPNKADDLREENEDIRICCPNFSSSQAYKLSFFSKGFSRLKDMSNITDRDFLGYVIVKKDVFSKRITKINVYESVIRPSRIVNNFIRGAQRWECLVAGFRLHVTGYIYAQQNGITKSCAHVACRSAAARFHKDGDMSYREMNNLLGIKHVANKKIAGEGLTSEQIAKILEKAGASCIDANYEKPEKDFPVPFQKYLYGSIESGYPAIIFFGTRHEGTYHTIPIFGHTFNEDTWVPRAEEIYFKIGEEAEYIPSESWVSTYIGHDDNCGSYFCIPRHFLFTWRYCDKEPSGGCTIEEECVSHVITTLPKNIKVNAIEAETLGARYLFKILDYFKSRSEPWANRLEQYAKQHQLVLRPILIEGADYLYHLGRITDWEGQRIDKEIIEVLRDYFSEDEMYWMVELSIPELFSANKRKVAEVLILAEKEINLNATLKNFAIARIPGAFAILTKPNENEPKYDFAPLNLRGHVHLYGCDDNP